MHTVYFLHPVYVHYFIKRLCNLQYVFLIFLPNRHAGGPKAALDRHLSQDLWPGSNVSSDWFPIFCLQGVRLKAVRVGWRAAERWISSPKHLTELGDGAHEETAFSSETSHFSWGVFDNQHRQASAWTMASPRRPDHASGLRCRLDQGAPVPLH